MFKMEGGKDFVVFNGPDEQFVAGRAIGADGGIGGTLWVLWTLNVVSWKLNYLIAAGEREKSNRITV